MPSLQICQTVGALRLTERAFRRLRIIAPLLFLPLASPAWADSFYVMVQYECNTTADRVTVRFLGAYNEEGEAMLANKGPDAWNPWTLVTSTDGQHIDGRKTITKTCGLSSGEYTVTIGPKPGNNNVQGRCGASMSAWTEIRFDDRELGHFDFQDDCHSPNDIITEVSVYADNPDQPVVKTVSKNEFFK